MKPNHVDHEWQDYWRAVEPKNAGETQRVETKKAFFAGAHALLQLIMGKLDPGTEEATDSDLKFMSELDAELQAFGATGGHGAEVRECGNRRGVNVCRLPADHGGRHYADLWGDPKHGVW